MAKLTDHRSCPSPLDVARRARAYKSSLQQLCASGGTPSWSPEYKDALANLHYWQRDVCKLAWCQAHGHAPGSAPKMGYDVCSTFWRSRVPQLDSDLRTCLGAAGVSARPTRAVQPRRVSRSVHARRTRAIRGMGALPAMMSRRARPRLAQGEPHLVSWRGVWPDVSGGDGSDERTVAGIVAARNLAQRIMAGDASASSSVVGIYRYENLAPVMLESWRKPYNGQWRRYAPRESWGATRGRMRAMRGFGVEPPCEAIGPMVEGPVDLGCETTYSGGSTECSMCLNAQNTCNAATRLDSSYMWTHRILPGAAAGLLIGLVVGKAALK